MTVAQAFDKFLSDRMVYCSPETIKTYSGHLKNFWKYLTEVYRKSIQELDFTELPKDDNIYSGFIVYMREKKNVKNVTIRSYCRAVKAFLRFCYEQDYCRDYLKGVKLPRDDSAPKMPLYAAEVEDIDKTFNRSTLKGKRNYAIVHLMLDVGLRSQEVRHLKIEHLDRAHNLVHIMDSKGNKSRIVLCPDFVFNAIQDYLSACGRSSGAVFLSLRDNTELKKNTLNLMFADLKKESGVSRLHPHLLRHTFATSYLVGGGNLEFLRVFMGHSDYTVTKSYSSLAAQCKMLGADIYKLDKIFFERGY